MLSMYKFNEIRNLSKQGHTYSEIARRLGIERRTVSKYLKSNTPPQYKPRVTSGKKDLLEDFRLNLITKLDIVPNWSGEET